MHTDTSGMSCTLPSPDCSCTECNSYGVQFQVGGITIQLEGDSVSAIDLGHTLKSFRVAGRASNIQIHVDRVDRLSASVGRPLFDSGTTWRLYDLGDRFQFDFRALIFANEPYKRLIVDRFFRRALLQLNGESGPSFPIPPPVLDYPLDELLIMHRLTQERAIELHGTGIVRPNGEANLFVGHSGAGKSTTTRLWTAIENVEVLSDDRIIVRRDEERSLETPDRSLGHSSKHEVLRLRDRSAAPTGHSAQDDSTTGASYSRKNGMRMYGTPWHGEAMFASPNSAPLSRIFVLEHGHGNVITRLTPSQAVAELFARSFVPFHRHEYIDSALAFLQELVDSVPVYRYDFEPDQRAVDKILHFHD